MKLSPDSRNISLKEEAEEGRMLGVILWSNDDHSRAVIWCEDNRDLAFYEADECDPARHAFRTGDLVRFDLACSEATRIVEHPELVSESEFPELASALKAASMELRRETGSLPSAKTLDAPGVIPFQPKRRKAQEEPSDTQMGEVLWRVFG
jgi:hypothetical protein